ncbi:MAG TPA: nucleoside recognition domain-containing protein [Clostridia bacterium]|nr:nucleoside recognition domain-containing protein [Clostridia bacterium]
MIKVLSYISIMAIPLMMTVILLHGWIKGVNIYDSFVEGAAEGFKTSIKIMPYLIAIFIAVGLMRKSGFIDYLIDLSGPLMSFVGVPPEVLPLVIMRPISGSGSLAILRDILHTYGPDSFVGRLGSTMMGSAETIFYTMAVYFGSVGVKRGKHTLSAALVSHLASIIAALVVCTYLFL